MTKRKRPKVRRPRALNVWIGEFSIIKGDPVDANSHWIGFDPEVFETGEINTVEARRLAAWLIRAADWIDGGNG